MSDPIPLIPPPTATSLAPDLSLDTPRPAPSRFILVETSHPGNVGAAARAMKVMGFDDLVLVAPRERSMAKAPEAIAMASGATDVLEKARVVDSLAEAVVGIDYLCATAMTPRDFGPAVHAPREHLADLAQSGHRVGFVFGSERFGLGNRHVYQCHAVLSIPTPAGYGSLNLAQAVQLIAYDWRCALGAYRVLPRTVQPEFADAAAVQGLLEHWEQTLLQIGFLDPNAPRKLMPRLNQLLNRAELRSEELNILRGIARAVAEAAIKRG
ncbi:MAG: RNA methyltransferase [Ideonella sp.]